VFGITKEQQLILNELMRDGFECHVDKNGWTIGGQTFSTLEEALEYAGTL